MDLPRTVLDLIKASWHPVLLAGYVKRAQPRKGSIYQAGAQKCPPSLDQRRSALLPPSRKLHGRSSAPTPSSWAGSSPGGTVCPCRSPENRAQQQLSLLVQKNTPVPQRMLHFISGWVAAKGTACQVLLLGIGGISAILLGNLWFPKLTAPLCF